MRRTLFYIPEYLGPVPVFSADGRWGLGLLLALVLLAGGVWVFAAWRRHGWGEVVKGRLGMVALVAAVVLLVLPRLVEPGRGLPIRGYGVMLTLALVLAVASAVRLAQAQGIHPEIVLSLAVWIGVAGIVGARALYVIEYWDSYRRATWAATLAEILKVHQGGLVVFGGLIGAAVAFGIFAWRHGLPALALADVAAPALALGQAIGRIGCFLNGCCFGGVSDIPYLAVQFPWGSPPHVRQALRGELFLHGLKVADVDGRVLITQVEPGSAAEQAGVKPGMQLLYVGQEKVRSARQARMQLLAYDGSPGREQLRLLVRNGGTRPVGWQVRTPLPGSLPVHPTQLYSTINGLVFFLLLWAAYPFRRRDGQVFGLLLALFPVSRFLMEWVRTDEPQQFLFGWTLSQTISAALLLGALAYWAYLWLVPGKLSGPEDWAPHNARWMAAGESA